MTNVVKGTAWARKDRLALAQRHVWMHSMPTILLVSNKKQQAVTDRRGVECSRNGFDGESITFVQSFPQPHPRSFRNATFSRTYSNTLKTECQISISDTEKCI